MRPKVLIGLVVVTVVVLAIAFMAKRHEPVVIRAPEAEAAAPVASAMDAGRTAAVEATAFKPNVVAPEPQPIPPVTTSSAELTPEERSAKIGEAITQINAAMMQNDSNSVAAIMAGLTNAEKEVREQAVGAVKQLGDRDLIPALTNLAARTENYEDRHALDAAADFLAQPTLAEAEQYMKDNGIQPSASQPSRDGAQGPKRGGPQGQRQANRRSAAPANEVVPNP